MERREFRNAAIVFLVIFVLFLLLVPAATGGYGTGGYSAAGYPSYGGAYY
ncbi:MAG: hypothetical protein JWN30_383 [Bacilli bacterium]|nr:hypothetical protein [Bacilli bacterium]